MASGPIDSVNSGAGASAAAARTHMASGSTDSVNFPCPAANASRRLGSILLDRQRAFETEGIDSRRNETTATAYSRTDYMVSVSFWMAEPPGISFFSVDCFRPPTDLRPQDFIVLPHVVGADGRFVLLRARFYCYFAVDEYFIYKAGCGESPSLEWVPLPDDDIEGIALGRVSEFGIVPCDHADHYLLAALCDDPDAPADYHLRVYSSETKAWSTRTLLNPCPGLRKIIPDKVITLGEGSLGWVDFSCGLVACDLRQDPPIVRFIPLPEPLPGNRDKVDASLPIPGAAARSFRDLACFGRVLKFFEMERHMTEEPNGPTDKDVLYDSDLITSLKRNGVDEKKPKSRDCWRAVTWSRTVCSNFWCKECTLSGDDVLLDEPKHSALVSRLRGNACGKLTLSDLYSTFPTLSTDGDNILFFMSVAEPGDQSGWVVSVDLGNRTVKAAVDCSFKEHNASNQAFRPCTLSRYLNLTPGTEVSACRKIVQGSFAKIRTKAFVHALRPPFPSIRPLPHVESNPKMKELQSILLMAGKNKRARNESHSIVQKDHVSETQPVQTNLTMQQCVNKLDQPFNPVFEQLPPALLLPGYENSKQLWQQPSPSNMPFGAFRPHKMILWSQFQYVLAGWEGSAHDATVLADAIERDDGFTVPQGKMYMVDAGYACRTGFLPPYRGVRYHLSEFGNNNRPTNARELYNLRHSSLRVTVERAIGALKNRFRILDNKPFHKYKTQVKLVLACAILHNWILGFGIDKVVEQGFTASETDEDDPLPPHLAEDTIDMATKRDSICNAMWEGRGTSRV